MPWCLAQVAMAAIGASVLALIVGLVLLAKELYDAMKASTALNEN